MATGDFSSGGLTVTRKDRCRAIIQHSSPEYGFDKKREGDLYWPLLTRLR
jgi:hypothetical protein